MRIFQILWLVVFCSCAFRTTRPESFLMPSTSQCADFVHFIEQNWEQKASGFYGFKGDAARANQSRIYFNKWSKKCLKGIPREQIHAWFGVPSIAYVSNDTMERIEYHFNEICRQPKSGCIRLKIHVDTRTGLVKTVLPIILEWVDY
jgi:hypothetical protein